MRFFLLSSTRSVTYARFGEVLLRQGAVSEADLASALAEQWGLPFAESPGLVANASRLIPLDQARQDGALAIDLDNEGHSVVALLDPSRELMAQVDSLLGEAVSFVVVTPTEFERLLDEAAAGSVSPASDLDLPPAPDPLPVQPAPGPGEPEGAELLSELGRAEARLQELGATMESISAAIRAAEEQAQALAETRERLAAAEARVAELTGELETERGRSEKLAGEVETRDELFATLRAKLGELSGALGTGS